MIRRVGLTARQQADDCQYRQCSRDRVCFDFFFQRLEEDEEHRHEEQQGKRSHKHTTNHTQTQRDIAHGTSTPLKNHRNQTYDKREGGHQDGTQTRLGGIECSFNDGHSLTAAFAGIFRNQNGSLGQQADEHDDTHLHIDVVLQFCEIDEHKAANQSEWHAQHDGHRNEQTLVETAEHDEYEQQTDGKHPGCG